MDPNPTKELHQSSTCRTWLEAQWLSDASPYKPVPTEAKVSSGTPVPREDKMSPGTPVPREDTPLLGYVVRYLSVSGIALRCSCKLPWRLWHRRQRQSPLDAGAWSACRQRRTSRVFAWPYRHRSQLPHRVQCRQTAAPDQEQDRYLRTRRCRTTLRIRLGILLARRIIAERGQSTAGDRPRRKRSRLSTSRRRYLGKQALHTSARRTEFIATNDHDHIAGDTGQIQALLAGGVAATNHEHALVSINIPSHVAQYEIPRPR